MTFRGVKKRFRMILQGQWRRVYYDLKCKAHGLDLSMVTQEELGLDPERASWCSNSGGPELEVVLNGLSIRDGERALDMGCGKGGAMITLARYPFARVDGVELSPQVASIAHDNFQKMRLTHKCQVRCMDATEFTDLTAYSLIYMYNPFPQVIMERVMENLARSLAEHPRPLTFIYKNPICHDVVQGSGFRLVREHHHGELPFYVYSPATVAGRWGFAAQAAQENAA